MKAPRALFTGLRGALAAPGLLLWLWLVNLAVAAPLAVALSEAIRDSVGASLVADELRRDFDLGWYGEFAHRARGVERSFRPTQVGAGAVFDNLELWFGGGMFELEPAVVATGAVWALVWMLMLGGVLAHFAEPGRGFLLRRFLENGGLFFFRFLRLTVLAAVPYTLVYLFARRLFPWIERITRDVTTETTVLAYNLLGAALIVLLLATVKMVFDFAKVAVVADERRSAFLAALRGLRFVLRHPLRAYGLYAGFGLALGLLITAYALVAPGAGQATWPQVVGAFFVGQAFLIARLVLRLAVLGGALSLYGVPLRSGGAGRGIGRVGP